MYTDCDGCGLRFTEAGLKLHKCTPGEFRCSRCFGLNRRTGEHVRCFFATENALRIHMRKKHRHSALRVSVR